MKLVWAKTINPINMAVRCILRGAIGLICEWEELYVYVFCDCLKPLLLN